MNRNILFSALLLASSFMLLSFFLRVVFFVDYLSLITHPLLIFTAWFTLTAIVLFFLKRDFAEIYRLLIFFEEEKEASTDIKTETIADELDSSTTSKTLDVHDDSFGDYSEVFENHGEPKYSQETTDEEDIFSVFDDTSDSNKSQNNMVKHLSDQDPKQLANLVKKYIN